METETSNLKIRLVAMLCIFGLITFLSSIIGMMPINAHSHENTNQRIRQDYDDIPADYAGFVEPKDEEEASLIQPLNASVSNHKTCNSVTSSHGPGRQDGFGSNFLSTGCGNYFSNGYNYGSSNIAYFINTTGFSTALINDIEAQAALWNQAVMHDGTGQIVNVNRVYQTGTLNGNRICEVEYDSDTRVVGLFTHPVWLFAPTPRITIGVGANSDTPVHEFGHLLGLGDLDDGHTSGTHEVLMGYSRGSRSGIIQYQDIQGIAVMNNRHTTHRYDRYVMNGSKYVHFCFFCDIVDSTDSAKSGSSLMATASSCTHTYQRMVSHGERHWLKCTKCYKVIESGNYMVQGLTSTTVQITGVLNTLSGSVTLPSTISGQSVTSIGASALSIVIRS